MTEVSRVSPHHVRVIMTNSDGAYVFADIDRALLEPSDVRHVTNGDPDALNCPMCTRQAMVTTMLRDVVEDLARAYRDRAR
jgi:hypothetical protein